ncbi:hypothetical protein FQN50_005556 [Emmonsiellopsis sp. PD_5]|nr:hypothetical protein FQN50_005556 [Emmonsiellopsis sp. PD_5]
MSNEQPGYSGEVHVPIEVIQVIDPNVRAALPKNTKVIKITPHGASLWMQTARVDAELDDKHEVFFLKVGLLVLKPPHTYQSITIDDATQTSSGDRAEALMKGEFTAMSAIHAVSPDFVPRPISTGSYSTLPNVYFLLCEFRNMATDKLPNINSFPAMLAALHVKGTSPNGKFGFPVTTYHGTTPLDHGWADTWEEFFTTRTKKLLEMEQESQGPNQEILELGVPFFEKVVPRLLRPLETGGRSIKPALLHGDLWHGNAATDIDTGRPIIFDAASFYGHNEYDLGVWRADWNEIGEPYMMEYHKHFPISEPVEDHDDRNALYATRVNILDSILYKEEKGYREKVISEMRRLVNKFPEGYQ